MLLKEKLVALLLDDYVPKKMDDGTLVSYMANQETGLPLRIFNLSYHSHELIVFATYLYIHMHGYPHVMPS